MEGKTKNLLVVEDNEDIRENIVEILQLAGYEVYSAENGSEGIKQALQVRPDLILCDVMMPVLDGFGMLQIMQKNETLNDIPLIFLTAKTEKSDVRKGMILGADDYLTKPFDDTELLQVVELRLAKSERLQKGRHPSGEGSFVSEQNALSILDALCVQAEIRRYSAKEEIFRREQHARWLYQVIEGQVKIFQENDFGKELTTRIFGPGEFFGYHALILDSPHENYASALSDCSLRLVPKTEFRKKLFGSRDLATYFIKIFSAQASEGEERLIEMAYDSVRRKVSNALLVFATKVALEEDRCTLTLSRDELAALAGTAKETLIRTLSDLKSEGVIVIQGKSIEIPSLKRLERIAH